MWLHWYILLNFPTQIDDDRDGEIPLMRQRMANMIIEREVKLIIMPLLCEFHFHTHQYFIK